MICQLPNVCNGSGADGRLRVASGPSALYDHISVQRLMDRFREASKYLFDRHFDDEFVADRFGWVEITMFLVMGLNYFDLAAKKEVTSSSVCEVADCSWDQSWYPLAASR